MSNIILPTEKKNLSTLDAALITLAESQIQQGQSLEDVKQSIYDTINRADCLSKSDKDSRKAQVRKALKKLGWKQEKSQPWKNI